MLNLKSFEDFLYEFGINHFNIKSRVINESNDKFNDDISKIVKIHNQNILVINDIQFAETLGENNKVYCIYFDKKSKPISTDKVKYFYVDLKRDGTDIHNDMKTSLNSVFEEFKENNIEFGFVFNISPEPYGTLNYEVVANLNFFIFDRSFTPGITAYYSFDEFDVADQFEKILYNVFKLKNHSKKKIDSDTWNEYGFEQKTNTDRYISVIFVQDGDVLFQEDLDSTDNSGATTVSDDDRSLIKGMIEPRIYAFRSDLIDGVVGSPTIKVGDTDRGVPRRMKEWSDKGFTDIDPIGDWSAIVSGCGEGLDGKIFRDKSVHKFINKPHVEKKDWNSNLYYSNELFSDCKREEAEEVVTNAINDLKNAFIDGRLDLITKLKDRNNTKESNFIYPLHKKELPYKARELQQKVIDRFIERYSKGATDMLIYAVMRFGKTFVACECVREYCGDEGAPGGKFILVASAKVDVKDEWIGSINPYSNYSNIDMYDSSFDEGGLITMLNDDREWIIEEYVKDESEEDGFKKDKNGEKVIDIEKSIPGPHPGKKYTTLEEYFKDFPKKNIMLFASLQDLNGDIREKTKRDKNGNIIEVSDAEVKERHRCFYEYPIDMLIIDESHFASQSKKLGEQAAEGENADKVRKKRGRKKSKPEPATDEEKPEEGMNDIVKKMNIKKPGEPNPTIKLHLSGTPYKLVQMGRFKREDIIAQFGFADLMEEKEKWDKDAAPKSEAWIAENKRKKEAGEPYEKDSKNPYSPDKNPYYGIPEMIQFGYNFSDFDLRDLDGKYNFATLLEVVGDEGKKVFKYEDDIYRMLSAIDGSEKNENVLELLDLQEIKKGNMCKHIVMVLQSKDSCDAMESFLKKYKKDILDADGNVIKKAFKNLGKYKIINIAGNSTNLDTTIAKRIINAEVERGNKTISLTVDKMLTGVTVKAWDTMFYMKDETAPQGYDQARFRIQSPYVKVVPELEVGDDLKTVYDTGEKQKIDMKPQTIFVDFSADRIFQLLYERYDKEMKVEGVDPDSTSEAIKKRLMREYNCLPIVVNELGKLKRIKTTNIMEKIAESEAKGMFSKTSNKLIAEFKWPSPDDDDAENIYEFSEDYVAGPAGLRVKAHGEGEESTTDPGSTTPTTPTNKDDGSVPDKKRPKKRAEMSEEELAEEDKSWVAKCDTMLRNIGIYLVVRKNDVAVTDFHDLFWDAMRTDIDINLETIINVFGDGVVPEDIEERRVKAEDLHGRLYRWKNRYLKKHGLVHSVEKYIIAISWKFGKLRKDYDQIKETLEEFSGGKLGPSEHILKDELTEQLFKDVVIFNKDKTTVLDCYGSKMGEIAQWLSSKSKFKDDFNLNNYYLIVKESMLAEISKVTLGLVYNRTMKRKGTAEYRNNFLNEHILVFDPTKGSLEEAIKNKWKDMKFDIVVGNPPYGVKTKGGSSTLHLQIMKSVLDFCTDKMCFIMPSRPITQQLDKDGIWYKMFKDAVCTNVIIVKKGTFSNTIMDDTAIYYIDRTPGAKFCKEFDIDDKIYNSLPIEGKTFIDKMDKIKQLKSFMIYGTQSKEKDFNTIVKNTKEDCWYLNINGANGAFGAIWISKILKPVGILTKDEEIDFCKIHDKTKNIIECSTKEYGENLKKLMLNGFVLRYSLWLKQGDRHIYQPQFRYVPDIDYTNIDTDEKLLSECGFTSDEIEKVMNYLKDFDFTQSRNDFVRGTEVKSEESEESELYGPSDPYAYEKDLKELSSEELEKKYPDEHRRWKKRFDADEIDIGFRTWLDKELSSRVRMMEDETDYE